MTLLILLQTGCNIAYAGMISGQLNADDKSGEKGVAEVKIICGKSEYDIGKMIIGDTYFVDVAEQGECTLQLVYKDQKMEIKVTSYDSPVDFNFFIKTNDDGTFTLERK